ncbi:MAG: 2-hydroxycarboxylate transporter family protein [Opitutaceae bacterium]|nr:2-hydroxycarboxylate transporter family protein [Opitutaceae bacterium]
MQNQPKNNPTPAANAGGEQKSTGFWPEGWWKLMEMRIGILPIPVFVVLLGIVAYFVKTGNGSFPEEICMMMAVLALGGFACGELGKRTPYLRHVGFAVICATFIPSALVYYKLIPPVLITSITNFTKYTNFLYLFIATVIVGSILGMDRKVLIAGFLKIFIPMAIGTVLAGLVGLGVGTALGLPWRHTFFYLVVPVMAGGVGEGAIPLSVGYSDLLHVSQGDQFAQILPSVMIGSLFAILLSGLMNLIGQKFPQFSGDGRLSVGEEDEMDPKKDEISGKMDVAHISAAASFSITLYLLGLFTYKLWGWPAPIAMLVLAVVAKLAHGVSPRLQEGSYVVYRFFATAVTYPLLFAIGVAMTPWEKLIAAFAPVNLITIFSIVVTMTATGFVVARWIKLYPIEMAIINACRCGQGGTGDIAILTASNRMNLMPFAQIATRIGGLATVTFGLAVLSRLV